ncbi:MAG TPA: nucleotide disphospho-sugar-binding domain-containing protein [Caulobacter sp.]|nr:nucleotide disphospho-sugar-binding domain-containing protein [Caulobacter sp.]
MTPQAHEPRRFLFTTWEGGGHFPPMLSLARRMIDRGHDVRLICDEASRADAEAVGVPFRAWTRAPNRLDRSNEGDIVRDWEAADPAEGFARLLRNLVTGRALDYARDLIEELDRAPADLVVSSEMLMGVMAACESRGQPLALFAANLCIYPLEGMPVFGPGLPPPADAAERALHAEIKAGNLAMLDQGLPDLNAARQALGLARLPHAVDQVKAARAYLLATTRAFDFEADPPAFLSYVGPQLAEPGWVEAWTSPWPADDARPLVMVGFSTTFQDHAAVVRRVVAALSTLPVRGVVTLAGLDPADVPGSDNVQVIASAPHNALMAQASVVITHGGHGTVMRALRHGLPMLVIPHGRDQAENAVRVGHRGAGLTLAPAASDAEIAEAVARLLHEPAFADNARRLGDAIAREAAGLSAADALESLLPRGSGRALPALARTPTVTKPDIAFIPAGQGATRHVVGSLHTNKVDPEATGGAFSAIEIRVPPGCGAPMHTHDRDAECFYVLSGALTFAHEDGETVGRPGDACLIPVGAAHGFHNYGSEDAVALVIVSPGFEAARFFDGVHERLGEHPDPEAIGPVMGELAARNGIAFVEV